MRSLPKIGPRPAPVPCLAMIGVILAALSGPALAHSFQPALLDLRERGAGVFDVAWKTPRTGPGWRLPSGNAAPRFPSHCRRLPGTDEQARPPAGADPGPTYWRIDCGAVGLRGERLALKGLNTSPVDVIIRITWRNGDTTTGVRRGAGSFVVPARRAEGENGTGASRSAPADFFPLGIASFFLGFDHLLFVLALILLVDTRRGLFKTISAFTAAHSIALALAAFHPGLVPTAPVEVLTSLSLLYVAAELTRAKDAPATLAGRYPWLIASAFGVLHGLGLAAAFAETGQSAAHNLAALLAFNVGVEGGQLVFIAAVLTLRAFLVRVPWHWAGVGRIPAYGIGALAAAWTIQRTQAFWT